MYPQQPNPYQRQQFNQPPPPQYQDEMGGLPPPQPNQDYEYPDTVEAYNSIIKDLISTDKILDAFELKLRGKSKDESGKILSDNDGIVYVKTDRAAREYVNLLRSMVNTHNDLTYLDEKEAQNILTGASELIPWWLMLQGDDIPKFYRRKIGFEGMSLINASLHKAINGRMMIFLKGSFREGMNFTQGANEKKGILDYVFPFKNKR